jgi:hypothetical protein
VRAVSFDELAFVLKRKAGSVLDPALPHFHLYGTDVVQTALSQGYTAYIADLPCIHNSRPVRNLRGGYALAYRHMQKKWKAILPLRTSVLPVTRWGVPLLKYNVRSLLRGGLSHARATSSSLDAVEIARTLGYD